MEFQSVNGSNIHVMHKQENMTYKKILYKILSKWYWFLISLMLTGSAGVFYFLFSNPIYSIESSILVIESKTVTPFTSGTNMSGGVFEGFLTGVNRNMANQIFILQSEPMIAQSIEELGLEITYYSINNFFKKEIYNNAPFRIEWDKNHLQLVDIEFKLDILPGGKLLLKAEGKEVIAWNYSTRKMESIFPEVNIELAPFAGQKVESAYYSFTIFLNDVFTNNEKSTYSFKFNTQPGLIKQYRNNLTIQLSHVTSTVMQLKFLSSHSQKGIDFLNKLTEVYQRDNLAEKNEYANRTIEFITSQIQDIHDSLRISESEMLSFRSQNQVVDLSIQSQQVLTQMNELDRQKIQLETQNKYYNYLLDYILTNQDIESLMAPSAMGINDPLLNSLILELNRLNMEKLKMADVRISPRLDQVNTQIENTKKTMIENIRNIIGQSEMALTDLNNRISQYEGQARRLPTTERNFVNIERKYTLNSETYTFLMQKLSEAQIAKASNLPESRILEMSKTTGKVSPNIIKTIAIALILGLFFPFIIIVIRDILNNKIESKEEVEQICKLPVLGHVYYNNSKEYHDTPVLDKPNSPVSEPYRGLRNKLNLMTKGKENPVIAVTSSAPNEGKTYTAINVASSFALIRKRTVLLDLDLRNSRISSIFDLDEKPGVVNYIMGKSSIDEISFQVKHPNFHVIPVGITPPNPGEMLMDERLSTLLQELKHLFDVIIIDSAPIGYVTDLFQINEQLDSILYVVRDRFTNRFWLKNAMEEVKAHKLKGVGIVINAVKLRKGSISSNYGQGYSYGYGYGYGKSKGKKSKEKV